MVAWLLQWGDMAEVLSPNSLRDEVRQVAEKIARVYIRVNEKYGRGVLREELDDGEDW